MNADWWGTLPAWVTAGIAFCALIAASISARANWKGNRNQQKQLDHQQAQLDQRQEDKRREQAAKVAVWVTTDQPVFKYRIANRSDLPIYDVVLRVDFGPGYGVAEIGSWRVIPPGERDEVLPDAYSHIDTLHMATHPPHIYFTDSSDQAWLREARGKLRESDEDLWPAFLPKAS